MNLLRARLFVLFAAAIALNAATWPLSAQGTLTTLFTNGPVSNRVNIVLLSEGYTTNLGPTSAGFYTTNELQQFTNDATVLVSNLLATPPFAEYSNYFNAFAISVASVQTGSDHPGSSEFFSTYFNSTYQSYGLEQLITIPPNNFDTNYNDGKGKVINLLTNLMPQYGLVILVVNYPESGGSGETPGPTDPLPIAVTYAYGTDVIAHETGHVFASLADEFVGGAPIGFTPVECPNVTAQTNRALIKWNAWISNSVPIPTPDVSNNYSVIGLFQGAEYQTNGWYRPKHDCVMNQNLPGVPFCEVCSEAIVKAIYQKVRPIDAFSPASPSLTLATPNNFNFSVSNLIPATHSLSVQWFTNNVAALGATNPIYSLAPGNFPNGNLNLRAEVRDFTPLVRNDPANLLSNSVSWTVNIAQSSLRLVNPRWLNSNRFAFAVTGTAPLGFNLQAATNFTVWTNLSHNSLTGGVFNYTNTGITNFNPRFYRAAVTNAP